MNVKYYWMAEQQAGIGAIGTKILDLEKLMPIIEDGIRAHDFSGGNKVVKLGHRATNLVTAGYGRRTENPSDFVLAKWRGRVDEFLKRTHEMESKNVQAIVYTKADFLDDPEASDKDRKFVQDADYVVIMVQGDEDAPLSPIRLVANIAGANNDFILKKLFEKFFKEEMSRAGEPYPHGSMGYVDAREEAHTKVIEFVEGHCQRSSEWDRKFCVCAD